VTQRGRALGITEIAVALARRLGYPPLPGRSPDPARGRVSSRNLSLVAIKHSASASPLREANPGPTAPSARSCREFADFAVRGKEPGAAGVQKFDRGLMSRRGIVHGGC
jgi:hypothetical protein